MIVTSKNFDIKNIKLIIWDLDNTFWDGTISEGDITAIPQNIELVKELSRSGIVNSICSKNDFETCKKALVNLGIWDYFVFPSIDWSPKSNRVLDIVTSMNLRTANTLFLDDEPTNLQGVLHADNQIMCGTAQELADTISSSLILLKKDDNLSRLQQYRELQKKVEAKKEYSTDEEFLQTAGIKVFLGYDCMSQAERIHELVNRTNQLNYTKYRCGMEELITLFENDRYQCAYISCEDKYCKYGIVGFYALDTREKRLIHYLFSCRTIGMGIEQYLYAHLNYPQLDITGDVVTSLNKTDKPAWIQLSESSDKKSEQTTGPKLLIKGPCDVSQIIPYFSGSAEIDTEFAYVSEQKRGMYIESFNHTGQVLLASQLNEQEKQELVSLFPFIDDKYFNTAMFSGKYDFVIFSLLTDYGLGIYRNKKNPSSKVVFGQHTVDYTIPDNWNAVIRLWMQEEDVQSELLEREYKYFSENYELVGRISDEELLENLQRIRDALPIHTKLILLNGAERPYIGPTRSSLLEREVLHKHFNNLVTEFAKRNSSNCVIIDVNTYLTDDMPYLDTINHYRKVVYYRLACAIQDYVKSVDSSIDLYTKGRITICIEDRKKMIRSKASGAWNHIKKVFSDKH